MDNTTEITSVLLTHITSGKGFKRNKLNYDGQEIYYSIIKLFAPFYKHLFEGKGKTARKTLFVDCLYEGLIAGGAIFLEPERKEETEKALDASCNKGEELEESIELMLADYKKLEEPIHSNGMQTEGSIFKPMNKGNAREMVRNALKNATTLHPEKEKAIKIVKELGVDMNEDDCKRWRHAITRLYKEELDAYKNRVNSIKNNKIRIRMSLDAASIDARDRQDVDDAADGDAAANAVNVGRLDAASIDARDLQDVDDAADGDAADCANVAANAAFYDVVDTLRQMPLARVFKPLQQDTTADDFDEIAKKCSYRRLKKRKFNEEYGDKSGGTEVV